MVQNWGDFVYQASGNSPYISPCPLGPQGLSGNVMKPGSLVRIFSTSACSFSWKPYKQGLSCGISTFLTPVSERNGNRPCLCLLKSWKGRLNFETVLPGWWKVSVRVKRNNKNYPHPTSVLQAKLLIPNGDLWCRQCDICASDGLSMIIFFACMPVSSCHAIRNFKGHRTLFAVVLVYKQITFICKLLYSSIFSKSHCHFKDLNATVISLYIET